MSASAAGAALPAGLTPESLRGLRVYRYAVGSALAMAVAMAINWQLSYLAPVLALSFLGTPTPRPTLREGLGFVAVIGVACLVGLELARHLLPYPEVYLPFVGLVLFRLFHAKESGASALLITWMIIALLVIPLLAMQAMEVAVQVARGIVFGSAVTLGVVWLTYGIFPDPPGLHVAGSAAKPGGPQSSPRERLRNAVLSTAVVWPMLVVFYVFQWSGALLVLVFVALLAMQPAFAKNFKAGGAMVIGNAIGGAAAIVLYELLTIVPLFGFLVLLTLLAALGFGRQVFSEKKTAALYGRRVRCPGSPLPAEGGRGCLAAPGARADPGCDGPCRLSRCS
jgi:hypothetical protein